MSLTTFDHLNLIEPLGRALRQEGYKTPTPIQAGAIPQLLKGRDLLGQAQTGTGKTAAFAIPTLQFLSEGGARVAKSPRALILTPTRELAVQVGRSFASYGRYLNLRETVIYGGVGQQPQVRALKKGVDIVIATPGRLLDLMNQGFVDLGRVEIFTLDEADRMLDMGFINDVKKIVSSLPKKRQSLFFSATMSPAVENLASTLLTDPASISVNSKASTADNIDQKVMFVDKGDKEALLRELLKDETIYRVMVFTRTKHRANRVAERLSKGKVRAEAIHGNKSQAARQRALDSFSKGRTRVLVATDVAARGIDVDGVTHVINFEIPNEPESYIHRIGRTARAGADGIAISFCDKEERGFLYAIEKLIRSDVPVDKEHSFHSEEAANASVRTGVKGRNGHDFRRSNRSGRTDGRRPFRRGGASGKPGNRQKVKSAKRS